MGIAARKRAEEKFSWAATAAATVEVYRCAIALHKQALHKQALHKQGQK